MNKIYTIEIFIKAFFVFFLFIINSYLYFSLFAKVL